VAPVVDFTADHRPALILRRIGAGGTVEQAGDDVGISRKTVLRWRNIHHDFGEAYARAVFLSGLGTERARDKVDALVRAWTPGGLVSETERAALAHPKDDDVELEAEAEAEAELEPESADLAGDDPEVEAREPEPPAVEPDVLAADGRELVVIPPPRGKAKPRPESPYTTTRPPTLAEWTAEMAAIAKDVTQPERVRLGAIASVTATLAGGPGARLNRPADDVAVAEAARERGREAGVPASVWQEARQNFLGPAPASAQGESAAPPGAAARQA